MSNKSLMYALAATVLTANGGVALAQQPTSTGGTSTGDSQDNDDGDEGKWGLLGLIGLAGLFGLKRRDHDHDRDHNHTTTR